MPDSASQLRDTIDRELPNLRNLSDRQASLRPGGPASWSPKEELGHLIDSASNNHLRFIRAALESKFEGPGYAQNDWVRLHGYHEMPWLEIVDLWHRYNSLLCSLVARIPADRFAAPCIVAAGEPVTLGFLIDDYILHLQHHVDHALAREKIATYPAAAPA